MTQCFCRFTAGRVRHGRLPIALILLLLLTAGGSLGEVQLAAQNTASVGVVCMCVGPPIGCSCVVVGSVRSQPSRSCWLGPLAEAMVSDEQSLRDCSRGPQDLGCWYRVYSCPSQVPLPAHWFPHGIKAAPRVANRMIRMQRSKGLRRLSGLVVRKRPADSSISLVGVPLSVV